MARDWLHLDAATAVGHEIKGEIDSLSAETLALSATLIHVLGRLIDSNPRL